MKNYESGFAKKDEKESHYQAAQLKKNLWFWLEKWADQTRSLQQVKGG
jgi:hypothetical protein